MGTRRMLGWIAVLFGGPVLALAALDRAIVGSATHWEWVASHVPSLMLDPYRVEGIVRTATAGGVVVLGNSAADMAFLEPELERHFDDRGLRFHKLTVGGAAPVALAMLAPRVETLEPAAVVMMVGALQLVGGADLARSLQLYDVGVAWQVFTAAEMLAEPSAHLDGLFAQLHVLARHRHALQRTLLIAAGRSSWRELYWEQRRVATRAMLEGRGALDTWIRDRRPIPVPSPNTRAIELLARQAAGRGAPFVLVEAPVHPALELIARSERLERSREVLADLARDGGFPFVTVEDLLTVGEDDFDDMVHMSEDGARRFSAAFAERLGALL